MKRSGLTYLEAINVFLVMGGKSIVDSKYPYSRFTVRDGNFCSFGSNGGSADGYVHGDILTVLRNNPGLTKDTYRKWEVEL
jgi:hypothetical protein